MKAIGKLAILSSLLISSLALADSDGAGGTLVGLEINTTSADTYLQYHGRAFIQTVTGKSNTTIEYRWGGTSCGTRTLSDSQIVVLQRALESASPIVPRYQLGQGDSKCLVGFRLAP